MTRTQLFCKKITSKLNIPYIAMVKNPERIFRLLIAHNPKIHCEFCSNHILYIEILKRSGQNKHAWSNISMEMK